MNTVTLEPVADDIWIASGPIVDFFCFPYPTRMVVVRLPNQRLWVWSPIPLDRGLREAVDQIGTVAYLISPNKLHHLYLAEWQAAYPHAQLWGPPATVAKRRDLSFAGVLGDHPAGGWADVIDQVWFQGSLLLDEVIFFHRPSRTVIIGDLSENFSRGFLDRHWAPWKQWVARHWKIVAPYGYAPLEVRLATLKRKSARATVQRMLDWAPERVIMAHGQWVEGNGADYLETAFEWLR